MFLLMNKSFICYTGCPFILDAKCVEYNGPDLNNLFNISTGATLEEILQAIDLLSFSETPFVANSTNTVYAVGGGYHGHSPSYGVRINGIAPVNLLTVSQDGLFVDTAVGGDGKVKVDSGDPKDYLEDQFAVADDGVVIMTVTPTKVSGKMRFVPGFDVEALLSKIKVDYEDEFCEIIHDCIPHEINYFTTTTTSTSSTTTTTTTAGPVAYGVVHVQGCVDPDHSIDSITFAGTPVTVISGTFPLNSYNPNMVFEFPSIGTDDLVLTTTGTFVTLSIVVTDSIGAVGCNNLTDSPKTYNITVNTSDPVSIEFLCYDNC